MDDMDPLATQATLAPNTQHVLSEAATVPTTIETDNPPLPANKKAKVSTSTRKKAACWDHFEKVVIDGVTKGICNYCGKALLADSKLQGTSNLNSHMLKCLEYPYRELPKEQKQKPKQEGNLVATSFSMDVARRALAEMVILDELPFRFVENYGFRRFCFALQPKFANIPSRTTVARDVIKIYHSEREKLKNVLKDRRICITTDTWTSIQNLNYMCLTCHFIDDEWNLHKRILNFCQVENHKGDTIGSYIEASLRAWDIGSIFTLTVDNASSNSTTIRYLQRATKDWKGTILGHEFLHMRCCAHILNLIVAEGLKDIDESISKVRDAVRYVRSSPSRLQTFKKCVEKVNIESKSLLTLDVPTRWNSTYKMLESAEKFEKAFDRLEFEDSKYKEYFYTLDDALTNHVSPPNKEDWSKCRTFVTFLRMFYLASNRFSSSLYVTSNAFFDEMCLIQRKIVALCKNHDSVLSKMALSMSSKFDKYWGYGDKINGLLYVAVLIDPRKKEEFLNFCFSEMYDKDLVAPMVENVKSTLFRFYEFYALYYCDVEDLDSETQAPDVDVDMEMDSDDPHWLLGAGFQGFMQGKQAMNCKNEVENYLKEPRESNTDPKYDVLGWWKSNASRYKVLSKLVRDVLAVPVSTVASESAFSTGGCILDPFRSSLSPSTVEALICTQDWLQASLPISLRRSMDYVEEFDAYASETAEELSACSSTTSITLE